MNRVYIETNGCAVLRHETQRLSRFFEANGWQEVEAPRAADLAVFTGCGVIDLTELAAIDSIRGILDQSSPDTRILVSGCLPAIDPEAMQSISPRVEFLDLRDESAVDAFIGAVIPFASIVYNAEPLRHHSLGIPRHEPNPERTADERLFDILPGDSSALAEVLSYTTKGRHLWQEEDLFEIRATWGCTCNCSFCATRLAIGGFESKPISKILSEVSDGIQRGYSKFMLMGDEVGSYGRDDGATLSDLVQAIHEQCVTASVRARLGIRYMCPDALVREYGRLRPYFASGFLYYFCAAFQSGSARVLKRMHRTPDLRPFVEILSDMNEASFPVYKHTQVMVGFPGETEGDLLATLSVLTQGKFDFVTLAEFSPRKGTQAATLSDQVSPRIKHDRFVFLTNWSEMNRSSRLYERYRSILLGNDVGKTDD